MEVPTDPPSSNITQEQRKQSNTCNRIVLFFRLVVCSHLPCLTMSPPANATDDRFPVAHLRSTLDSRFSFRSEESFSNNAEEEFIVQDGLQSIVANEEWFQVCANTIYRYIELQGKCQNDVFSLLISLYASFSFLSAHSTRWLLLSSVPVVISLKRKRILPCLSSTSTACFHRRL